MVNIQTGHFVELQPDNVREYRSPDFLLLRCQLTLDGPNVHIEPIHSDNDTLKAKIERATSRKQVEWTPFVLVNAADQIPPVAPLVVRIEVHLHSDDIRVPLMARVAADFSGEFSETVSGQAGVAQVIISVPQTYYVSVSHPSIRWRSRAVGWEQ